MLVAQLRPIIKWTLLLIPAIISVLSVIEQDKNAGTHYRWLYEHRVFIIFCCAMVAFVAQLLEEFWLKKVSTIERAVKAIVAQAHATLFAHVPTHQRYAFRVTVFRCRRLARCGFRQNLVIYSRSGPNAKSKTRFRVGELEEECEGVAGQCWYRESVVYPQNLPDFDIDQAAYARAGFLEVAKAKRLNIKSQSITAVIIKVSGVRWGVLVLDARRHDGIQSDMVQPAERYAELIGFVLQSE